MKVYILQLVLYLIFVLDINASIRIDQPNDFINLTLFVEEYKGEDPIFVDGEPLFSKEWGSQSSSGLSKGPTEESGWYKISLLSNRKTEKVVYFNYTLIPNLELWVMSSLRKTVHIKAGTNNAFEKINSSISNKGYPFLLPVDKNEEITIYFTLEGEGWPIHTEVFLYDVESFISKNINENITVGYLRSITLTLLAIGLIVGLFSHQKVFIFYTFTFLAGIAFAETEIGLFKNIFGVEYTALNYILRHVFNLLYVINLVYFYKNLCSKTNKFDDFLNWYLLVFVFYSVISVGTLLLFDNVIVVYFNFIAIVILSWVSFIYSTKILFEIRNDSSLTKYIFVVQVTRLLIIAVFVTLPHLGLIERLSLTDYMYYIFIVYESTVYFYLLVKRSVSIYNEKVDLKRLSLEEKKRLSQAILEGQEKERNRIGRELHDSIGGNLALVNKSLEKNNFEVKNLLSNTITSIRDLSHELISPNFQKIPLRDVLIDIVSKYNSDKQKVFLQFHDWPTIDNVEIKHHCFRIVQELLNNAEKHSNANLIFLQFFANEETQIGRITYEDNGIGFNVEDKYSGVGLRNIKFRANSMDAQVNIESSNQGTFISIENILLKKAQN